MSVLEFPENPWLKKYYERGFRLIFFGNKKKGPEGSEAVKWTERADKYEDYRPGQNVGCFTGVEISENKYLVDIDFDWSDGVKLAKRILPSTQFGFGRESRPLSHVFYTTPQPVASMVFEGIDGRPIVELRGTKQDGTIGLQTMVPISIHPSGEQLILKMDGEIGHADDIVRRVSMYATACILFSALGHRGMIHDARLAVAGFLLSEGMSVDEVTTIGEAIAEASGNNVQDVKMAVNSTATKLKQNEHIAGKNQLIKFLGDDGKKIIAKIKEWLGGKDFIEDAKGKVLSNQENIQRALEKLDVKLTYDDFSCRHMMEYPQVNGAGYKGPYHDDIINDIRLKIERIFKFLPPKDYFFDVVYNIGYSNRYHPIMDYLKSLEWDGQHRLEEWLIRGASAADSPYVRAVSRIVLTAAVRRITQPGCKYDEMVVLESGEQGLLKSTALRTLCPHEKWFSDDLPLNVDAKQIVERTAGKWIIEASDLSGMHASQVEQLKGMLSRQVDGPVRMAYARLAIEQPRQFVIIGTTNSYAYLSDSTGNRRFWPIRVKKFDVEWLRENRDQLWAEAYHFEQRGASIRLDPSLYEYASMQQDRRRTEDPWEIKLDEAFPRDKRYRLTMDEVWAPLGISIDRRDPRGADRVMKAMHRLGFKRMSVRNEKGGITRGFGRDEIVGQQEFSGDER